MKTCKKNVTLEGVNPSIVKDYACEDIDLTFQLHNQLLPQIEKQNLQQIMQLDCDLVPVIAEMEYNGVLIDSDKLLAFEEEVDNSIARHLKQIERVTKDKININSKVQLSKFLFKELNLIPIGEKGKSGQYSVSSEVLNKLMPQHEIVGALLDYNALKKVKGTFIKALKRTDLMTGRLHTSYNQTVTETGRLSSSNPNLQNIPSRTVGKLLRQCFVAPKRHKLVGADYSNIELRVMAILSNDPLMIQAYREGVDLHSLTASKIFSVPYDKVDTVSQRPVGKTINFGLIYGMGAIGLSKKLANEGQSFTVEQCKQFINDFFELYSGVARHCEELVYKASINGFTETIFGRKRSIPGIISPDSFKREAAKRLAMNTPIQGTAADILKMAMVNIHKRIQKENLKSKMILQVHDELLFEVPNDEVQYMEELVKSEMENVVHLSVPLKVDLKKGQTWADVH